MSVVMQGEMGGGRPLLGIVGAGRAGGALAVALHRAGYRIAGIASRDRADSESLASLVGAQAFETAPAVVERSELTLVAVPDPEIAGVATAVVESGIDLGNRALVHCSARQTARELREAALAGAATGVLHPLQALAGPESADNLPGSHFRIEGAEPLRGTLVRMAVDLEGTVVDIPEPALDLYHAAAVLAGNAPVTLLARAARLLEQAGVSPADAWDGLAALLQGAAANARRARGPGALTGPVARGDVAAIAGHLEALASEPAVQELYRVLSLDMVELVGDRDPSASSQMRALLAPARGPSRSRRPRVA